MHINYYSTNLMSSLGSPGQSEAERRSVLLSLAVSVVFKGAGWVSAGRLGTQSCCARRRLSESVPQPVRHTLRMSRSSLGSAGEQGVGTAEVLGLHCTADTMVLGKSLSMLTFPTRFPSALRDLPIKNHWALHRPSKPATNSKDLLKPASGRSRNLQRIQQKLAPFTQQESHRDNHFKL